MLVVGGLCTYTFGCYGAVVRYHSGLINHVFVSFRYIGYTCSRLELRAKCVKCGSSVAPFVAIAIDIVCVANLLTFLVSLICLGAGVERSAV